MKIKIKRKNIIYIIVAIMMIAAICVSAGVVKYRKNKKAKEAAEARAEFKNEFYSYRLHIVGEFSYEGNKIYVEDIEYNYNQLMVDVAFFNYKNENEKITTEQLYEEYEAFLNGEKTDILDKFVHCDYFYTGCDYDVYRTSISNELWRIREEKEKNGEDISTKVSVQSATPEELQEAIDRVNKKEN